MGLAVGSLLTIWASIFARAAGENAEKNYRIRRASLRSKAALK